MFIHFVYGCRVYTLKEEEDKEDRQSVSVSTPEPEGKAGGDATMEEDQEEEEKREEVEEEEEEKQEEEAEEEEDSGRLSMSMLEKSSPSSPQQLTEQPVLARWLDDGWFYKGECVPCLSSTAQQFFHLEQVC